MSYDHVAMIPFMLDASYLTKEEAAERAANPALWAARRYGQPEHIFRAAAERHGNESTKRERPQTLANYVPPTAPFCPATPHLTPQPTAPLGGRTQQPVQLQSIQTQLILGPPRGQGTASPDASSPSGSYFSTVLSPPTTPGEMDIDSPESMQQSTEDKHKMSKGHSRDSTGSVLDRVKDKARV